MYAQATVHYPDIPDMDYYVPPQHTCSQAAIIGFLSTNSGLFEVVNYIPQARSAIEAGKLTFTVKIYE